MDQLTMDSEGSICLIKSNLIGGVATVCSTISKTNIQNSQTSKVCCVICIRNINLVFSRVHIIIILRADDWCFNTTIIDEGPGDLVLCKNKSTTREHYTAAIVDSKLVHWRN